MTCAKTISIITVCLISLGSRVGAQTAEEVLQYEGILGHEDTYKKKYKSYARQNKNELQLFFSGLFLGYKAFISSQDGTRCNFSPSCSEYSLLAVKRHGALKGLLMTFDRLTRCNGLSPEKYKIDVKNRLLIDNP